MNKHKKAPNFSKLEEFLRRIATGVEPEVKGIPAFRQMWRRLGNSEMEISGIEAVALEEILNNFCPDDVSQNGNSRAVVDGWIQKCVLEVLDKKSGDCNEMGWQR